MTATRKFKTHFRLSDAELDALGLQIHTMALDAIETNPQISKALSEVRELLHAARMNAAKARSDKHFGRTASLQTRQSSTLITAH